jgi:hypothetical protein
MNALVDHETREHEPLKRSPFSLERKSFRGRAFWSVIGRHQYT